MTETLPMTTATIAPGVSAGGDKPLLISGPCVLQEPDVVFAIADRVAAIASDLGWPAVFKASFDKANRTSITSRRGPGIDEGLKLLEEVKKRTSLPVTTDVHESAQVPLVAEVVDLLQVPAFLCRQTDMVVACAQSGRATSIKKGQFLAPWDMRPLVEKYHQAGGKNLMLIERGTTFGYNNLVVDFRGLNHMRALGVPVIMDATHSVQSPGGNGGSSGGDGYLAPLMLRCAAAAGVEGFFIETHSDPSSSPSDGPNMIPLDRLPSVLNDINALTKALPRPQPVTGW